MTVLTEDLLLGIRERAADYDRDNTFPFEDLDALRAAGYLAPRSLLETARDQRMLAAYAPATALAVNMHLVWVGVARVLKDRGDSSLQWVLDDAAAGELFAFGNSEPGNDLVLWDSLTTVDTVEGGYAFTGTKIFTSLSPAWTRLGVFGKHGDTLIHGFITRDTPGWRALDDWDTLGMRATQSHTTVLEGAVVPEERVARILPVGPNADPFVFGIFANFLLLIGSVYAGIADRALELGVEAVKRRTSLKTGETYDRDPDFRWRLADAALALDALAPQLETLAADVDTLADHGSRWFRLLTGAKHRSTETARYVVDQAMRSAGGGGYRSSSELARLQRDVLAGIYHPSDTESVHSTVATNLLG
ncbi:alkylation response protein AidB-like acyl-CoA dehydrogenase [Microbacteriaceae bacterium SG_E_30_P1]|uniref:Alkylation response protein AidB-like acyl-CoA dehydrogenase n=1 Tax=Antiquaquibacter oligotrophicus TaxID=2880260 RepID=A0ABT6KQG5_9MICO|nr:acyl-CoA dehydrogenase family protein [Antiquaquibacter oligotrophicus]MDH6182220.1 alkylation response protein AidB-like acyl-CoA dehydrogenase [Antiquaquibacter oligotrophicus]UDF12120.1 acyl-CoA/acyl-ACP dehydrogenase [Antiquaquibacter oligotrophicus]